MRAFKSVLGIVGALLPIAYCGGLFFYFLDTGGSVQDAVDTGLGPTLLGLGGIGLLLCVPLVFKLLRMIAPTTGPTGDLPASQDAPAFDADAALARYLARKAAASGGEMLPPSRPDADGPAPRPGFGRKPG